MDELKRLLIQWHDVDPNTPACTRVYGEIMDRFHDLSPIEKRAAMLLLMEYSMNPDKMVKKMSKELQRR